MGHHKLHICERFLMKLFSSQLLVQVFIIVSLLPLVCADLNSDKQALQAFAAAVPHGSKLQWDDSTNICTSWVGISCNSEGTHVIGVELEAIGLTGPIPTDTLGGLDALRVLNLGSNSLSGSLPYDLSFMSSLRSLILQHNRFTSNIPDILPRHLRELDLSHNYFIGDLPASLGFLSELHTLNVQCNRLQGPLPYLNLPNLSDVNFSSNNFSGAIPSAFRSFPNSSFHGNRLLCGDPLDPCPSNYLGYVIDFFKWLIHNFVIIFFIIFKDSPFVINFRNRFTRFITNDFINFIINLIMFPRRRIMSYMYGVPSAYQETYDTYYNDSSVKIGEGSMGETYTTVVYSQIGHTVALKLLKHVAVNAEKFVREMNEMARIGHHSDVSTIYWSEYSTYRKAVAYQYYELGNLKSYLHVTAGSGGLRRGELDLAARVSIALGTAKAIAYIHEAGYIHGNLKSSNVFTKNRERWEIAVSEHGLALLTTDKVGGYLAPEVYSIGPDEDSDVYCFGVLLLEILTGKIPNQAPPEPQMCNIVEWVIQEQSSIYFYDHDIRNSNMKHRKFLLDCGLACTSPSPTQRPKMNSVVESLERLRQKLIRPHQR